MLAKRWNSPELITLDIKAMEAIFADKDLLASLEKIEMFSNVSNDLSALISTNKELRSKKLAKEKLSKAEAAKDKEAKDRRKSLKDKLQAFITRIPVFVYLTDDREATVKDIITQLETDLFEKVTSLSLRDFARLDAAGVFDSRKTDDAVWKFRSFEKPSLSYITRDDGETMRGGWETRRDERFADLIEKGLLVSGDTLINSDPINPITATVSDDFGLLIDGLRNESPDLAAIAASGIDDADGWTYWTLVRDHHPRGTLQELRAGEPR